jgi:hypothetical protein
MVRKVETCRKKKEKKRKSLPLQKVNERIRKKLMERQKLVTGST